MKGRRGQIPPRNFQKHTSTSLIVQYSTASQPTLGTASPPLPLPDLPFSSDFSNVFAKVAP